MYTSKATARMEEMRNGKEKRSFGRRKVNIKLDLESKGRELE
jgi:hypothetical protein